MYIVVIRWSSAKVVPGVTFLAPAILQIDTPAVTVQPTCIQPRHNKRVQEHAHLIHVHVL